MRQVGQMSKKLTGVGKLIANRLNIMIDIETVGKSPGCGIVQIAAVPFRTNGEYFAPFEIKISADSCMAEGLVADQETMVWWDKQPREVRDTVFSGVTTIREALGEFYLYLIRTNSTIIPWCKGAGFDVPILEYAMRKFGIPVPWGHRSVRCFRTLESLFTIPPNMVPTKPRGLHDALVDADYQARTATTILNLLEIATDAIPGNV